jgi:hypothetical protein
MSKVLMTLDEQIKKQQERLVALKARKQAVEARAKLAASKKERADDTRRKILLGAMVLDQWKNNPESEAKTKEVLDKFLTKDLDRKLFDLSQISQD